MAPDDFYASPFGAGYSAYMERPWLGRRIGRLVWGGDTGTYYESMDAAAEVAAGGTIVDCPCGAGPALRAVRSGADVRYVAADLSPAMLRCARKRARARGLTGIEFLEADATDLPLPPSSADLFLSFWGLHCFDEPVAALEEAARLLKPGARLVGSSFVSGADSWRQRLLIRPGSGDFACQIGTQPNVEDWLATAGFETISTQRSGPMLFFEARLRAGT
jgi:ubiquinone/menaquinone biosynthesis C-methylase UbiE